MKQKTYFSTIAFLIFSHLQNLLKIGIYWYIGKYEKVTVD